MANKPTEGRRKLVEFDAQTWHALNLLSRESMKTFQELADEAFRDLLQKYGQLEVRLANENPPEPMPAGSRERPPFALALSGHEARSDFDFFGQSGGSGRWCCWSQGWRSGCSCH
jgi:hypothetical protein